MTSSSRLALPEITIHRLIRRTRNGHDGGDVRAQGGGGPRKNLRRAPGAVQAPAWLLHEDGAPAVVVVPLSVGAVDVDVEQDVGSELGIADADDAELGQGAADRPGFADCGEQVRAQQLCVDGVEFGLGPSLARQPAGRCHVGLFGRQDIGAWQRDHQDGVVAGGGVYPYRLGAGVRRVDPVVPAAGRIPCPP